MEVEKKLVDYLDAARFESIPREPLHTVRNVLLTVLGTTIAGSSAEGCGTMIDLFRGVGGKEEATILIHGGKVPAQNASFVNGVMARALDYCDAMAPGVHIGSSAVPAAFAAAELAGGCSGRDFLTALTVGTELSARLNLSESAYDGFDPTGVCSVFAATAAASKILRLNSTQTWHALALAFNRSGGSFQANIDGSLAVRVIQGWVAQSGITCAQFARAGITGPANFLEGVYGYFHLFGRDRIDVNPIVGELGERFELQNTMFKKYPSCGATQGSTEAILDLMREVDLRPEDVDHIDVAVPPYVYKLVGHPFRLGENPRVNAQFSIQYCIASALLRAGVVLEHFEEAAVRDPEVLAFLKKIHVKADPELDKRGHTALDMRVMTARGTQHLKQVDIAPGFPGNPLTQDEHQKRFWDCVEFAPQGLSRDKAEKILSLVNRIEELEDVRDMIPHLLR
ncbi:MAG: MmgE/PrpD family protein [Deltaproteobacteria bacterium]|nr:MmgE/PrpD family protein [Deltaproteobacteria bacterium]